MEPWELLLLPGTALYSLLQPAPGEGAALAAVP